MASSEDEVEVTPRPLLSPEHEFHVTYGPLLSSKSALYDEVSLEMIVQSGLPLFKIILLP